ncbi:AAA family ATPase, partial [uncultured Halomonas sp.]|uniref:AAA family ATPase n=1 Tax=uncultured Halomonas sp. TaxID=173971 RepID=UPI00262E5E9F
PSRLSRMPGIIRNGRKQFLIATNIGKSSWVEWQDWIESVNDDLPDPENMATTWDSLPELSPPLIDGVLRQGHKMLIAGPSKAGKSFALIQLCAAIAEGKQWFGWDCAQGPVLYVNLELDRASCLHRFRDEGRHRKRKGRKLEGRGFSKRPPQKTATRPIQKWRGF